MADEGTLRGTAAQGIQTTSITGNVAAASPASTTFTLPAYGVYLVNISAWAVNNQSRATVVGLFKWYSGNNANNWTNVWNLLGAVDIAATQTHLTAFAVSNPTTAGVVTLTWTFSDAGSQTCKYRVTLRRLSSALDEYLAN